jgi:hypothetical protein
MRRAAPTYGSRLTHKGPLGSRPVHTPSAAARRPTLMNSSTPKVVAEYAQEAPVACEESSYVAMWIPAASAVDDKPALAATAISPLSGGHP